MPPPMPVPLVPLLATPPDAAFAEKAARTSVPPPVPKNVNPPPRPLPARLTPVPPVAKLLLTEVSRMVSAVGPLAKMAPPSALPPG